jgi:hypothetical protein
VQLPLFDGWKVKRKRGFFRGKREEVWWNNKGVSRRWDGMDMLHDYKRE